MQEQERAFIKTILTERVFMGQEVVTIKNRMMSDGFSVLDEWAEEDECSFEEGRVRQS